MAAPNVCQPSAAHLASGRVNLAMLREAARREFLDLLDACAGSKAIVWDDQLTGPFGLIAEYSLLKEHEVDKMFALRSGQLPAANVQHIIFLLRPKLELMELVAENIREERDSGRREFSLVFVPRGSLLCEKQLKDLGVYGNLSHVKHFGLHLIPFDSDLLSMEAELSFRECCLESDYTSMFDVAKGIMTLQSLYGIIPEIHGKGDCARKVADMLQRMQRELGSVQSCIPSSIDSLVLLDRSVDLLTPLATQLTYEGLIDELYGVKNMYVKLPPEKFLPRRQGEGPQELPTEPKRLQLSSAEELHAEIRDRNFNAVGEALSRRARNITAAFEERHQARTVGEIKQFVSRLPHMQTIKSSLATHTAIAELIQEATRSESFLDTLAVEQEFISGIDTDKVHASIEELISQRQPLERVLRLMCMQSLCSGGLKPRTLDHYRREILQAYGFEHLSTLFNLEKVGLLRGQIGGRNPFPILRKSLRLQLSDVNEKTPNDISYVYSGYAPLSVRLVQFLARPGWRSIEEVLRLLPSPEVDERQPLPPGLAYKRGPGGGRDGESSQRVTLVFFLGGVTFAEVAALRFLAQTDDGNTDYIIGTTKLINGNTWLKSLMDTF